MPMLILQLALLIAIAFVIGAIIGRARRKKQQGTSAQENIITAAALAEPKPENAKVEDLTPLTIAASGSAAEGKKKSADKEIKSPEDKDQKTVKSTPVAKVVPPAEPVGPAHAAVMEPIAEVDTEKATAEKTAKSTHKDADKVSVPVVKTKPELLITPRNGKADDLTKIKGIGTAIQGKLNKAGIYHYDQLVDLNAEQQKWLGEQINFRGRVEREDWVNQSKKILKASEPKGAKKAKPAAEAVKSVAKKSAPVRAKKSKPTATKAVRSKQTVADKTD